MKKTPQPKLGSLKNGSFSEIILSLVNRTE